MQEILVLFCIFCVFSAPAFAAEDGKLRSPYPISKIREHGVEPPQGDLTCPRVPEPLTDLSFFSIYDEDDETVSQVDKGALRRYKEDMKPLTRFEVGVSRMANLSVTAADEDRIKYAECALDWLEVWAKSGALLGDVNAGGEAVRKWTLAVYASSYVQIAKVKGLDKDKRKTVEAWLSQVAYAVKGDYSTHLENKSRQNNHLTWAAWAVTITGIAVNDRTLFDWGMEKARFSLNQIGDDGTLPLEMARAGKAFHYHLFIASPMVMLAEAGKVNGVNLYGENRGAIYRLVRVIMDNLDDPYYFKEMTGVDQNLKGSVTAGQLAWLEPFNARFPQRDAQKWFDTLRSMSLRRIGGDMTMLYGFER